MLEVPILEFSIASPSFLGAECVCACVCVKRFDNSFSPDLFDDLNKVGLGRCRPLYGQEQELGDSLPRCCSHVGVPAAPEARLQAAFRAPTLRPRPQKLLEYKTISTYHS